MDIHHYPPILTQNGETEKPEIDLNDVMLVGENIVMPKTGQRMLIDIVDYNNEQQAKARSTHSAKLSNSAKPYRIEKLSIIGVQQITGQSLQSVFSLPFYLLFSHSAAFIQLMRSLVLRQTLACVSLTGIAGFLLPLTSNCGYLFVERELPIAMEETDCSECLNEGSTDLFAFWNYEMERLNFTSSF